MRISKTHIRKAQWIGLTVTAMMVFGCAGIEPYEPHNNREEGPKMGLFTGSEGEWVILRKADEPKTESEAGKTADETAVEKEKKTKIKSGAGQP